MQMYPAYKLDDVLNEYALVFFALLNEGYRLKYQEYLILSNISLVPHGTENSRKAFLRQLQWAAQDPSDILKPSEGSPEQDIKKILG